MADYRRARLAGGSYFFTVKLRDPHTKLLVDHIGVLRTAFRQVIDAHPFAIDAIVVLPNHLHTIWTMPPGDYDYSTRWRLIKGSFSRALAPGEAISMSRRGKGERGIWQRRFWEHTIRDERGFANRFHYIHFNPVKHGLVLRPRDWPYSSFHRAVRQGVYPPDWYHEDATALALHPEEDD